MQSLDLKNAIEGNKDATNFHTLLFRLIFKADGHNRLHLKAGFPNAVKMVETYLHDGTIEELPYD